MIGAQTKSLTYSPTNMGIEQEYWQSLFYRPRTRRAGLGKIKARIQDSKTQAMPKLLGSCYTDLTKPQGVTPVY